MTPIHSIPFSVAQPLQRGSNNYYSIIQGMRFFVIIEVRKQQGGLPLDIRVLQYFLTVVREESITRAAEALQMTQLPLSRQLKDLEDKLGKNCLFVEAKKSRSRRTGGCFVSV